MSTHPIAVYEAIKDAYLRHYDTAFRLRDAPLRAGRRALLEEPGVIFTDLLRRPRQPTPRDGRAWRSSAAGLVVCTVASDGTLRSACE